MHPATTAQRPADSYSPLYFLASLGAGGLSVSFFMYLMFWLPHPGRPVPIFEDIAAVFAHGSLPLQAATALAVAAIAVLVIMNLRLLVWNLGALARFKQTDGYAKLLNSNAETTLLAAPLAMAMTVNALFIVGLVFVPKLWTVVEYLFPAALVAFVAIGAWALMLLGRFLGRVLGRMPDQGGFDSEANNSLAQMMPSFALAMVAVGLAAPAAMSTQATTVAISLILSGFFGTIAIVYGLAMLMAAVPAMLRHGIAREAAPTLLVIVPLLTVLGIMGLRQSHGLHTTFDAHVTAGETLLVITKLLTVQIAVLLAGWVVLHRQGYFATFVAGPKASAGSYALVCPGVAVSVMIHFFVNKGLVDAGVIAKFDVAYWAMTAVAIAVQFATIALVIRLNRKHFRAAPGPVLQPAE